MHMSMCVVSDLLMKSIFYGIYLAPQGQETDKVSIFVHPCVLHDLWAGHSIHYCIFMILAVLVLLGIQMSGRAPSSTLLGPRECAVLPP